MLRERLKVLTKPFHDELESASLNAQLTSKSITKDDYSKLLLLFYSVVAPVEEVFANHSGQFAKFGIDVAQRAKKENLIRDLSNLGVAPKEVMDIKGQSFEWAVGAMYTLEGSTMGGMFISRELALVDFASDAHSYFNPYGEKTMPMWKQYCDFLSKIEEEPDFDSGKAILAACEMFLTMQRALDAK